MSDSRKDLNMLPAVKKEFVSSKGSDAATTVVTGGSKSSFRNKPGWLIDFFGSKARGTDFTSSTSPGEMFRRKNRMRSAVMIFLVIDAALLLTLFTVWAYL